MLRIFLSRQYLLFLITSGTSAVANFSSRILFNQWLDYSSSVICAYIVGMLVAFLLARQFVFTDSLKKTSHSAFQFVMVNLFGMFQTWAVSLFLLNWLLSIPQINQHAPEIAHGLGLASLAITSYVGHKYWTFR